MNDIERAEAAQTDGTSKDHLKAQLKQARDWHASVTSGTIGGGPFNTEAARMLLAAHVQLLETLVEGKPSTKLPSRHHV